MNKVIKKYELQLIALFGAISGILFLVAILVGFEEVQNLFSALDNWSTRF